MLSFHSHKTLTLISISMAAQKQKVRPSPLDDPPTASSSSSDEEDHQPSSHKPQHEEEEEEEEVSSEEEASSQEEDDDEEEQQPLPTPVSKNPKPSSSESDAESESQTESEPDVTPAKVKPLASKPMAQAQTPKAQPSPAPSKSGSKRAAENNNVTDPKRAKKKSSNSSSTVAPAVSDEKIEEDRKKSGDVSKPRRWSEEDEIAILKGVIDFTAKTGQDPLKLAYSDAFFDFMRKALDVEISKNQLKLKVRRLKKKFETTVAKGENNGGHYFTKPHEQKAFELSKKAWGSDQGGGANGVVVEKPKSNGSVAKSPKKKENGSSRNVGSAKKPKSEIKSETKSDLVPVAAASSELKESEKMVIDQNLEINGVGLISTECTRYKEGIYKEGIALDDDYSKRAWELIGESKRAEFEARWKNLRFREMELLVTRTELISDQTKCFVKALQSDN